MPAPYKFHSIKEDPFEQDLDNVDEYEEPPTELQKLLDQYGIELADHTKQINLMKSIEATYLEEVRAHYQIEDPVTKQLLPLPDKAEPSKVENAVYINPYLEEDDPDGILGWPPERIDDENFNAREDWYKPDANGRFVPLDQEDDVLTNGFENRVYIEFRTFNYSGDPREWTTGKKTTRAAGNHRKNPSLDFLFGFLIMPKSFLLTN